MTLRRDPEPAALDKSTADAVGDYLALMVERDPGRLAACFAEDADWYIPGPESLAPWLGRRTTRRAFEDFFRLLFANAEPVSADIQHIFIDGDAAVVTGEFVSRMVRTGKVFSSMFSMHIDVRDGLIVRYRLLEDSFGLSEAVTP